MLVTPTLGRLRQEDGNTRCQFCLHSEFQSSFDYNVYACFQGGLLELWGDSVQRKQLTEGCLSEFPEMPNQELSTAVVEEKDDTEHLHLWALLYCMMTVLLEEVKKINYMITQWYDNLGI